MLTETIKKSKQKSAKCVMAAQAKVMALEKVVILVWCQDSGGATLLVAVKAVGMNMEARTWRCWWLASDRLMVMVMVAAVGGEVSWMAAVALKAAGMNMEART